MYYLLRCFCCCHDLRGSYWASHSSPQGLEPAGGHWVHSHTQMASLLHTQQYIVMHVVAYTCHMHVIHVVEHNMQSYVHVMCLSCACHVHVMYICGTQHVELHVHVMHLSCVCHVYM